MSVTDFDHALVRAPGRSVVAGLRMDPSVTPDFAALQREHAAYIAALRTAGVTVEILEPLEDFPDSVFVEDPALVFAEGAILLRPGAPSRLREREFMRPVLEQRFARVLELGEGEDADGGDVMVTAECVLIGLSKRTSEAGAAALARQLATLGRKARIVETPASILHFKTASSLLDEETVLATAALASSGCFAPWRVLLVPEGEEAAANALRVNDRVLLGNRFGRTGEMLERVGYRVELLAVDEIGKLDAGLSCLSLRWRNGT